MPEQITVSDFLKETWDDYNSPTTSSFTKRLSQCRNTVNSLEEKLDIDRSSVSKMKKSVKALYNSIKKHVENEDTLAENIEHVGESQLEQEPCVDDAFNKFSTVTKELSGSMNELVSKLHSMLLFPLDTFLKNDLKGVKGDLRKPLDKTWKDYETKFSKIEKEKRQLAKEVGMTRETITGAEIAEEMEKERKVFQLQLCEYLIRVNEIKTKKGVDLLLHLVDYYRALTMFFQEGLKTINHFQSFIDKLVTQLETIKRTQNQERNELVKLRDALKGSMASYKEMSMMAEIFLHTQPAANKVSSGYSLHQLQGNKMHGFEKEGNLLKKSEGRMKRIWQKRKCRIVNGIMSIGHSDESKDPVKLNLLTCQVKLVHDDPGKKCFDLVSQNRTYHFQAEDEDSMKEWISVLNNAKEQVLMKAFHDNTNSPCINQNVKELTGSILQIVKRLPGNNVCCDCNAKDPEWLSTNLGVLICLECCGIHRQLGVHISRTQSIVIDELGTSQLLLARVVGNQNFNEIVEAKVDQTMKLKPSSPMEERLHYIKAKYEQHKYAIITSTDKEDLKQDLKQAIIQQDIGALIQVYAEGADLMTELPDDENSGTALHLAIEKEDGYSLHIVDFIVQNSHLNSLGHKNKQGNTALHVCSLLNKTECMKLILRTQPELANVENNDSQTPLDIAKENNHEICIDLLKAALQGRKDVFGNVNVDWDLTYEEHFGEDQGYSDDDLESTPERNNKNRSRPPSLVTGASTLELPSNQKEGLDARDRALSQSQALYMKPKKFTHTRQRSSVRSNFTVPNAVNMQNITASQPNLAMNSSTNHHDSLQSHDKISPSGNGPPLPPRMKKPPPPPPSDKKHARNKSEPFPAEVIHRRSISDPPSRPPPPEFRKTIALSSRPSPPPEIDKTGVGVTPSPRPRAKSNSDDSKSSGTETPPLPLPRKKSPVGQKFQALFDCDADNDDELTFAEGEIILVLREEEDDWWEGTIEGHPERRGLFPKTFVQPLS
ncbi:arf-GAP with SH3 domain, ANK repeat and PH domain-containing protein 2-like isoform X3 [Mytilus edulis]|uniref:arf-GAP with SH3 domain, ANK repeat and PH domain-containing protein 2-like isoform X3 n=1 Tax=Mytilus edulis TaxID=6550 RepID=UPI0039EE8A5A